MIGTKEKTKDQDEKGSEIDKVADYFEARMKECFLLELETAGNSVDMIAEHFEKMIDRVDLDGSVENFYMLGFVNGFKSARSIESDFQGMAIINVSRKMDDQSTVLHSGSDLPPVSSRSRSTP